MHCINKQARGRHIYGGFISLAFVLQSKWIFTIVKVKLNVKPCSFCNDCVLRVNDNEDYHLEVWPQVKVKSQNWKVKLKRFSLNGLSRQGQ